MCPLTGAFLSFLAHLLQIPHCLASSKSPVATTTTPSEELSSDGRQRELKLESNIDDVQKENLPHKSRSMFPTTQATLMYDATMSSTAQSTMPFLHSNSFYHPQHHFTSSVLTHYRHQPPQMQMI